MLFKRPATPYSASFDKRNTPDGSMISKGRRSQMPASQQVPERKKLERAVARDSGKPPAVGSAGGLGIVGANRGRRGMQEGLGDSTAERSALMMSKREVIQEEHEDRKEEEDDIARDVTQSIEEQRP